MINSFSGEYRWLSNFWPCDVVYCAVIYPSLEHAYQAAKTEDPKERNRIWQTPYPAMAKRIGQRVTVMKDWDKIKLQVMYMLLGRKFAKGTELAQKLIDTNGHELVEGNHWGDTYWGVCAGEGHNHLGNLLMMQRDFLLTGKDRGPKPAAPAPSNVVGIHVRKERAYVPY
jgi:ribA/ribD-fused uncharacterized protein